VNEAAADLLLKQNPTPLEPASSFVMNSESYQIARVTWLPDYLGNNKSHGGGRVNGGGKDVGYSNCEKHGYVSNCTGEQTGTQVSVSGLICYKDCRCPPSKYKYIKDMATSFNCQLSGEVCIDNYRYFCPGCPKYSECICSSEYKYVQPSVTNTTIGGIVRSKCLSPRSVGGSFCKTYVGETTHSEPVAIYKECNCPDGEEWKDNACVKVENCAGYPLTVCPSGGTCSPCPSDNAKLKLVSCDESKGWTKSGNTCVAKPCPAGYTAGVTGCSSGSTKPDYSSNGWSGGQQCGVCKCNNTDSNCTAANYPVTSIPAHATQTGSCSTGCGSERVTRYKFKCNDSYILKNNQCQSSTYVKLTVNAPDDNTTLKFSLSGSGYTIDWGDGTTDANSSHTYDRAGDYIVTMTEGVTQLTAQTSDVKITKLHKLNMNTITKARFSRNCTDLTGSIPELPPSLTNGDGMFSGCSGLTGEIPSLPPSLTDGSYMFKGCTGLTGNILELPTSLKSGRSMFEGCTGLTGKIPSLPTSLEDGSWMFAKCTSLTDEIPALPTSLTNGAVMFSGCTGLTGSIPELPNSLTNGGSMFYGCTGLTGSIPELPSSLTNGDGMFGGCTGLTGSIPELPSSLTDGGSMFWICSGLTGNIPALPSSLTDGSDMFLGCSGLTGEIPSLPTSLINGSRMFGNCNSLTGSIPELPNSLTDGFFMFGGCTGLTGNIPELPSSLINGYDMFDSCKGLTGNIPALPSSLTKGGKMFLGCTGLTGNIPALPSSLENGNFMFESCSGLNGNIPNLPSSLTDGAYMFSGCTGLTGNIPTLPTSLENGGGMFQRCTGLTGPAPSKPASLTSCKNIFYDTNVTTTSEWNDCPPR